MSILTMCAGRIIFDSTSEKIRHSTTTQAIEPQIGACAPPTINIGTKAAIVVNTPKVAGIATFLAPAITASTDLPRFSISLYALSPMIMASSTTMPSTRIKPNKLIMLIETLNIGSGNIAMAPRKHTGIPTITQKAIRNSRNKVRASNTKNAPINRLVLIKSKRPCR